MAEFEPDPEGNNIDFEANLVPIEQVFRINDENKRRLHFREFGKNCICRVCTQDLIESITDNADRSAWINGKDRWSSEMQVVQKSRKKKK